MSRFLKAEADGGLDFSEELMRTATGHFDISLTATINASNLSIRAVDPAVTCQLTSLTVLDLSRNSLSSLHGLAPLARSLVRLDVSYNNVTSVEPLAGGGADSSLVFASLEVLRLQGNLVRDLASVLQLARLPKLRAIYLREQNLKSANPVCDDDGYAASMAKAFTPKCRCVDGHYFCHADVRPRRIDDGSDDETALPATQAWVTDAYFASAVTDNAGEKFGANSEAQVKAIVADTRKILERNVNV